MNEQGNSQPQVIRDVRFATNLLMAIVQGIASTGQMFLHYRFGREQPGLPGILGLVAILVFAGNAAPFDPRPLLVFAGMFLVACFFRRLGSRWRMDTPTEEHSWWGGYSYLSKWFPKISEHAAKTFYEPLLVFSVGTVLTPLSPPLGVYLLCVATCMFAIENARVQTQNYRLRQMQDRYIEQKSFADAFRRYGGRR